MFSLYVRDAPNADVVLVQTLNHGVGLTRRSRNDMFRNNEMFRYVCIDYCLPSTYTDLHCGP